MLRGKKNIPHPPTPSLYTPTYIAPTPISVPMLVCGALDDCVIGDGGENAYKKWRSHLRDSDRLWLSDQGKHFFHFAQWQPVSNQIRSFWNSLSLNQAVLIKQQIKSSVNS